MQIVPEHSEPLQIIFSGAKFTNGSLLFNWYKDTTQMNALAFLNCDLKIIEVGAFNSKSFNKLRQLTFHEIPFLAISVGAFDHLNSIDHVNFDTSNLINLNYRFLNKIAQKLRFIIIRYINLNTYNVLGALPLLNLEVITMFRVNMPARFTSNAVSNAPNLLLLSMSSCGIEVLEAGCFDRFPLILVIRLSDNYLKTLPIQIFRNFNVKLAYDYLRGNPFECDCNVAMFNLDFSGIFDVDCAALELNELNYNCNRTDSQMNVAASEARKCLRHFGTNTLRITYTTKFLIKINYVKKYIFLKSPNRGKFYLIALDETRSYADAICWTTTAKYAAISLIAVASISDTPTICVMDMFKTVWPLNCISFRIDTHEIDVEWLSENDKPFILTITTILSIALFLLSIGGGTLIARHNLNMLKGIDRVIIQRNRMSNRIESVLVMPNTWKDFKRVNETI